MINDEMEVGAECFHHFMSLRRVEEGAYHCAKAEPSLVELGN